MMKTETYSTALNDRDLEKVAGGDLADRYREFASHVFSRITYAQMKKGACQSAFAGPIPAVIGGVLGAVQGIVFSHDAPVPLKQVD